MDRTIAGTFSVQYSDRQYGSPPSDLATISQEVASLTDQHQDL
jgi:hypothetical protein